MFKFIHNFIVRTLMKMLSRDLTYESISDKQIENFYKAVGGSQGFSHYLKKRDYTILKAIGNGQRDEQYWVNIGRRLELLRLNQQVNDYFKKGRGKTKDKKNNEKAKA